MCGVWYKPFYPYVSWVKRSSTYSIPQKLQQLCVYSEVYFVVKTLCLNTDTMCIVGKVDSSLYKDAPGFTVHCITEKPKGMNLNSMISEWKIFNVLWHTQPTHCYYCWRKLNSLVLLFMYIIYFQSIFKWNSSVKQLRKSHCSCLQITSPTPGCWVWCFPCSPNTDELREMH